MNELKMNGLEMDELKKAQRYLITEGKVSIEGEEVKVYGLAQFEKKANKTVKLSQIDDISPNRKEVEELVLILENEIVDACILIEIVEDYVQKLAMV